MSLFAILHAEVPIEFTEAARERNQKLYIAIACVLSAIGSLTLAITAFVLLASVSSKPEIDQSAT